MEAKLASSGLTLEDGRALGMKGLSAEETKTLHVEHLHLPSLFIPYDDPWHPGQPLRAGPGWPEYYRLRILREPVPKDDRFHKYHQPSSSGTLAYFPRNVVWADILTDYRVPIIITEGELKAACAGKNKLPTIGLGGVWSWKALKQGHLLLPELAKIVWPRRETYIIFDSDSRRNPQVCAALQSFAETLCDQGAIPMTVILPEEGDDGKVGLDDFIVAHGVPELEKLLFSAEHVSLSKPLWELSKTYVYVKSPGVLVEQATGALVRVDDFKSHTTTAKYSAAKVLANGTLSRELVGAAEAWVRWPMRNEAKTIVYAPGKEPLSVIEKDGQRVYNVWPGWGCQPKKGDVKLWLKLVDHIFTGAEPEAKRFFVQWLAWPLQHPGAKLLTSVVLWSTGQGQGKTLIGETMRYIYGANFSAISQEAFAGAFNTWATKKQFVCGDDVSSTEKKRDLDRMKMFITQTHLSVNEKFQKTYDIEDTISYLWSSNHADVLALERADRRFFVHEVTVPPLPGKWYEEYDAWIRSEAGASALFDYLLNVDLTGFRPNAAAPLTAAKAAMIRLAQPDLDGWLIDLLAAPDDYLKLHDIPMKADLFSLVEIRAMFTAFAGKEPDISQTGLSKKLAMHNVRPVNNGENLYVPHRPLAKYFPLRRREHWAKQSLDAIKRHLGSVAAAEKMRGGA